MPTYSTANYQTLRRAKTVLRYVSPLIAGAFTLLGLSLFATQAATLVFASFSMTERIIRGIIALGFCFGLPAAGFLLLFLLRAAADLIDLWIDLEIAADKTSDLMERQLLPGVHRIAQLLEQANEQLAGLRSSAMDTAVSAAESRHRAIEAVRGAIRSESWDQAKELARSFAVQFPQAPEAAALIGQVQAAFERKLQALRDQLDEAERAHDSEAVLIARDRLSAYVEDKDLTQLDRRVARWLTAFIRESLAKGRAHDMVTLAERVSDMFGDTTREGAQVRASLPTLRRSAGLCPDCAQPYDVSLLRCPSCEAKRAERSTPAVSGKPQ